MKDKFQPLTATEHILAVVVHNTLILFGMLQLQFYKFFSNINEAWYVHIQRKGSKGDYHLAKLGEIVKAEAASETERLSMIHSLVVVLFPDPDDRHCILRVFYPGSYARFAYRKWFFDQQKIVLAVKNEKDLLRAGDLLGYGFRARIQNRYGLDVLIEYQNKGNLHELLNRQTP